MTLLRIEKKNEEFPVNSHYIRFALSDDRQNVWLSYWLYGDNGKCDVMSNPCQIFWQCVLNGAFACAWSHYCMNHSGLIPNNNFIWFQEINLDNDKICMNVTIKVWMQFIFIYNTYLEKRIIIWKNIIYSFTGRTFWSNVNPKMVSKHYNYFYHMNYFIKVDISHEYTKNIIYGLK